MIQRWFIAWLCSVAASAALAAEARLAIIIDDLGNDYTMAQHAMRLPAEVTLAVLPRLHYSKRIAAQAFKQGHELILHQPMASLANKALGPGGLTLVHGLNEMSQVLQQNLQSVPHVAGVNNHMGSLLTRDPDSMRWLMSALQQHGGLYFIDSRTDTQTQAEIVARESGVASARRDIFLDNERDPALIREQLAKAIQLARQRGSAIAIGHPYPETLAVLLKELPEWQKQGVVLLPVSKVIEHQRRPDSWHASSYPLPKVAKN